MGERIEMCADCGFTAEIVDTYHAFHKAGGVDCLRRQLAAANERAGRLEAERDELQQRINRASEKALLLAQKILGGA